MAELLFLIRKEKNKECIFKWTNLVKMTLVKNNYNKRVL